MGRKRAKSLRCPTCRTLVLKSDPQFPFCSEHCRSIDLGKWASGAYRISGSALDPDAIGEAGESVTPKKSDDGDETIH